jgi:hypothetical protein
VTNVKDAEKEAEEEEEEEGSEVGMDLNKLQIIFTAI